MVDRVRPALSAVACTVTAVYLSEIAERAATSETSTADLLRQLKIVAARAQLPPLADWVTHELGGYPQSAALPTYRGPFGVEVVGDYSGPMNGQARNVPIAPLMINEQFRSGLFNVAFYEGIAGIETLVKEDEPVLHATWPADAIGMFESVLLRPGAYGYGTGMMPWALVGARRLVPRNVVVNILAAVRDRVLDLALELERVHPEVVSPAEPATRAAQINSVTAIIYGNAAIGSSDFEQLMQLEIPSTKGDLFDRLREYGIDEEALAELDEAIVDDTSATAGKARVGANVASWLGKHADKAVGAGVNAASSGAGAAISQLVLGFLGLGGS